MSAFGIFAIVLTVVYAIYYGVMLAYDQYGVKGQKKDEVEEFGRPSDEHDRTRRVKENGDGTFTVTEQQPESEQPADGGLFDDPPAETSGDDNDSDIEITEDPDEDATVEGGGDKDEGDTNYTLLVKAKSDLPLVVPTFEAEYDSMGMSIVMSQPIEAQTRVRRETLRY